MSAPFIALIWFAFATAAFCIGEVNVALAFVIIGNTWGVADYVILALRAQTKVQSLAPDEQNAGDRNAII